MSREQDLYKLWLDKTSHNSSHAHELSSIADNPAEITDRFYRDLEFGTAGIRGVLGLGTNRMNIYTVRHATQGLASFLLEKSKKPTAAIAYDSRNFSKEFAREAACVLAANGVTVHIYKELMPTPALSYAVRELKCDAGVVITASHNPAEYNGYKAYGTDGCQQGPAEAARVTDFIGSCDMFDGVHTMDYDQAMSEGKILYIPESFVQKYISRVLEEILQPEVYAMAGLSIVYTPLNGAGGRCVRTVLAKAGAQNITAVPEQEQPDGNFPTCPYPNPEMPGALRLGLELCEKKCADILLATDPDADRVAVAARHNGEYRIFTGNETGVLLMDYIARTRTAKGKMPKSPIAVRSIVSSKLADMVAAEYSVEMLHVLTGFKFIGEVILGLEQKNQEDRYIFGFEESCGYLTGSYVRDKDAVNASLLIVEMASALKLEGKTLVDSLSDIYRRYGTYKNAVQSYAFEGELGMHKMDCIMSKLRENPPAKIAGRKIIAYTDYQTSTRVDLDGESKVNLPPSNVLEYELDDKCAIIIRPSGTEPQIKLYYSLFSPDPARLDELYAEYTEAGKALVEVCE